MDEAQQSYSTEDDARYNDSTEELDKMVSIIEKAEEIKADSNLYKLVMNRMQQRGRKMTSIADLRGVMADQDADEKAAQGDYSDGN